MHIPFLLTLAWEMFIVGCYCLCFDCASGGLGTGTDLRWAPRIPAPPIILTPLRQEQANLPVEPFFLNFHQLLKFEEKNDISLNS